MAAKFSSNDGADKEPRRLRCKMEPCKAKCGQQLKTLEEIVKAQRAIWAVESNKDEGRTAVIKERTSAMSMKAAAPAEATSHWGQQEGVTLW